MKQKIKIMNYKQELSDEEIQSYMNFNRVLENRKAALISMRRKAILKWSSPILLVTLLTIGFFAINHDRAATKNESLDQGAVESLGDATPALTPSDSVQPPKLESRKAEPVKEETEPIKREDTPPPSASVIPEKTKENLDQPVESAEGYAQAEPLDGYPHLYSYFNAHLVYPASALKDSIQGVQTISFIINKDGSVEQIEVEQSLGAEFEKESIRLIQNMPEWKPARLDGKPVATRISLPITFQIQKIK